MVNVSENVWIEYMQMVSNVVMGFVKDAGEHIDVQGFNVYHKNRLIKVRCYLYRLVIHHAF